VVIYDTRLYRCVLEHTSLYTPNLTPALWERITVGVEEWFAPSGAHDAYNIGDRVMFQDVMYESLIDGNTFSPADYPAGWTVVGGTEPEAPAEWVQPTGAGDAYNIGDRVTFEGKAYESLIDGNTWSPTAYPAGWQEIV
jgi:hypothetical protein